jgi:hypothetical protein
MNSTRIHSLLGKNTHEDRATQSSCSTSALGSYMRASVLAVFGTAVVVLVSALAEPRTPPDLRPDSLARLDAIASFCEKADPVDAAQFEEKLAGVTLGHSEDELQLNRHSVRYHRAMTQADETLSRVLPGDAVRACTEFLADN